MAVQKHSQWQKERLQKRTKTAKPRTVKLGQDCDTFALLVYYNITHKCLDGDIWLPKGQSIPDVQAFAKNLLSAKQNPQIELLRRPQGTRTRAALKMALGRDIPRRSNRRGRAEETTPVLPEITVVGSDTESTHDGDRVYSVPVTPEPAQSETERELREEVMQPLDATDTQAQHHEQAHEMVHYAEDPINAQQDDNMDEDAEGEPQEVVSDHTLLINDGTGGVSTNFPAMFPDDTWMQMPMPSASSLGSMDVGFDRFDLGDIQMSLDGLEPGSPSQHCQVAKTAVMVSLSDSIENHPPRAPSVEQGARVNAAETSQVTLTETSQAIPTEQVVPSVMPRHSTPEEMPHAKSPPGPPGNSQSPRRPTQPVAVSPRPHTAATKFKMTKKECLLRLRAIRDATAQVLYNSRSQEKRSRRHGCMSQIPRSMQPLPALGAAY